MGEDDKGDATVPPDPSPTGDNKPAAESSTGSSAGPSSGPDGAREPNGRDHDEAYVRGRRLTTSGAMTFNRDASIEDLQIGDRYIYYNYSFSSGGGGAFRSVPVRDEVMRWVRSRYVPVRNYGDLLETLEKKHVLVLNGRPGTGRFTTALRLLDHFAAGEISRLDGDYDLTKLRKFQIEEDCGYVVELTQPRAEALTERMLDQLTGLIEPKGAYLVLICHRDGRDHVLGEFAKPCPAPNIDDLVVRHLTEELRHDDCEVEEVLLQLYTNEGLRSALASEPTASEAAQIAGFLADMARGEMDLPAVETRAGLLVRTQVEEWFAQLSGPPDSRPEALRLTAFRISLAVFHGSEYDLVVNAGVALATRLLKKMKGEHARSPEESLFADDHGVNLPASRATMEDGFVSFGGLETPTKLVMFADDRFPVVLLSHLWHRHHKLREAVLEWLTELSDDRRDMVWVRAAQAMGLFCSLSFSSTFTDNIEPLAVTEGIEGTRRRRFAAIALDQAARDERMADVVFERLQEWRRHGNDAQQWTAAAALGYDLGLHRIDDAMRELRVLGTPSERRPALQEVESSGLVWVAGQSIANLLAFGAVRTVLTWLADWTCSDRQSVRELARRSIMHLIYLRGYDRGVLVHSAGRRNRLGTAERERWPLLLALLESDPRYTSDIADLVRWGLRSRDAGEALQRRFRRWVYAAEEDSACLGALADFLPHLIPGHSDFRRLQHLIDRMRRDWSDPINENTALVLENVMRLHSERTAS